MSHARVPKEEGVTRYKRQKCPNWTPELLGRQKQCIRKMRRDLCPPNSGVKVVIDDESDFPFSQDTVPGNDCFFSTNKENIPSLVRYRQKKKYEPKVLVWLAVSEDGHSEPFFRTGGPSINGEVYREECIRCRLQPFL